MTAADVVVGAAAAGAAAAHYEYSAGVGYGGDGAAAGAGVASFAHTYCSEKANLDDLTAAALKHDDGATDAFAQNQLRLPPSQFVTTVLREGRVTVVVAVDRGGGVVVVAAHVAVAVAADVDRCPTADKYSVQRL